MGVLGRRQAVTSPRLSGADFCNQRRTFPPDTQNVPSRVDISIMRHTAVMAFPMPYSQACDTFRAAESTALRTGCGSPSLVSLDIHRLPSGSFVTQHVPERRPTRIQDGFRHLGLSEAGCVHVANDDQAVFTRELCAGDVQLVATRIGDLGADCADAALVARALCCSERTLALTVMLQRWNARAVAACGKRLKPEIDTNLAPPSRKSVRHLTLKHDIPASTGVFDKRSRKKGPVEVARLPKPEALLEVGNGVLFELRGACDQRDPTKGPARAAAGTEMRSPTVALARRYELSTSSLNRIGMKSKISRGARTELNKIESARPPHRAPHRAATLSLSLNFTTVIPNDIHGARVSAQPFCGASILEAELVRDNHNSESTR